jgi:hypothetical protein
VINSKATPTILAQAARNFVVRPDLLTLEGRGVEIISAGWVRDRFRPAGTDRVDQKDLRRILVRNGQPGRSTRIIEYLLRGSGDVTVGYDSQKGGSAKKTVTLRTAAP